MDVRIAGSNELAEVAVPLLAVPVLGTDAGETSMPELPAEWEEILSVVGPDLRAAPTASVVTHRVGAGPRRLLFLGVGPRAELDAEAIRRFAARAVREAERGRDTALAVLLPGTLGVEDEARAAAEGTVLAAWRFRELRTGAGEDEAPAEVGEVVLLVADEAAAQAGCREGVVLAEAENYARVLQERPGNVATPSHLGDEASRLAAEHGLEVDVLGPDRLAEERMNALLAVSLGSAEESRLIVLRHRGGAEGEQPLVLVGKGLTFDAGGISIKPAAGMEEMKYDMSGGAAVLAAMVAIARLGVRREVIGIVPSSENLPSGEAVKPGDVVTTRNGRTVEVVNTDAEGRLILCDALDFATGFDPEAIVDCATLTGAVTIALGSHAMAVLGNDDTVVEELRGAGERTGERCWPLPLWKEYRSQLDGTAADLVNVGGRPAGTITAACFLGEFVGEVPWAHLDVAGTAYGDGTGVAYRRKGGYGVPTRLLVEWVRGRAG